MLPWQNSNAQIAKVGVFRSFTLIGQLTVTIYTIRILSREIIEHALKSLLIGVIIPHFYGFQLQQVDKSSGNSPLFCGFQVYLGHQFLGNVHQKLRKKYTSQLTFSPVFLQLQDFHSYLYRPGKQHCKQNASPFGGKAYQEHMYAFYVLLEKIQVLVCF